MKAAKLENLKIQLKTLVDKGIITQAQADKRLSVMTKSMNSAKPMMKKMHKEMMF